MNMVPLGELMPSRIPSVNPSKHLDEMFELWSIPAFDQGEPERLKGSEIGSSKKCVEPDDVLLSRIVPHIRRSWVVGPINGARQIASGEWIPFRSPKVFPPYLRHVLVSDEFHAQFMKTVAGVGGSLLRARPEGVKKIEVPLPPLEEQKRIAAILDQADALRRLRQRAIDRLNALGQAIFHEMFGDPKGNPKGLPWIELGEVADFYSGNTLPESEPFYDQIDGHLVLKVSDLNHPKNQQDVVCAASWSASPGSRAGTCPPDALVFPKRGGAIGTNKKRWLKRSAILDPNLMGVHPNGKQMTMSFLNGWFQTFNLSDIASGSSVPQLNKKDLAPLKVALPPVADQVEYSRRIEALSGVRDSALNSAMHDEKLFGVLQHRAFRGEL